MLAVSTEPVYYDATILVEFSCTVCLCEILWMRLSQISWKSIDWSSVGVSSLLLAPPAILCGPYCLGESYPYIPGASATGGVIWWRNVLQTVMPSICVCLNLSLDQGSDIALWNVTLIPIWTWFILSPNMNRRAWDHEIKATYFCILSEQYRQRELNFVLNHFSQNLSIDHILRIAICTPLLCGLPRNCIASGLNGFQ